MKKAKRYDEGGDVPEGGRFAKSDPDIYRRARAAVERQMLDEQFGNKPTRPAMRRTASSTDTGDETARLRRREVTGTPSMSSEERGATERQLRAQALEPVQPEMMLAPPLGPVRGAAAALASRGAAKAAPEAARTFARAEKPIPNPKRFEAVKRRRETEREASRMEGEGPGPAKPKSRAAPPKREPPRDLDEMRMSGEGPGFKKGGKIDGIAQRGKTRGRYI
jgi:hypothetical protein